jgi:hypothetical protein
MLAEDVVTAGIGASLATGALRGFELRARLLSASNARITGASCR